MNLLKIINPLMEKISKENKLCYIMGDFNLDLLNCHSHQFTSEFLDVMYSNMFFPLITRPTRITSNTATLIDNIFTNHLGNYSFSGLLLTDISDHLPIFCFTYEHRTRIDNIMRMSISAMSKTNIMKFHDRLSQINWDDLDG